MSATESFAMLGPKLMRPAGTGAALAGTVKEPTLLLDLLVGACQPSTFGFAVLFRDTLATTPAMGARSARAARLAGVHAFPQLTPTTASGSEAGWSGRLRNPWQARARRSGNEDVGAKVMPVGAVSLRSITVAWFVLLALLSLRLGVIEAPLRAWLLLVGPLTLVGLLISLAARSAER